MAQHPPTARTVLLGLTLVALALSAAAAADPPMPAPALGGPANSQTLNLAEAVSYGLQNNPALAATRQQHGIAAAGVVLARVYPFNPVLQSTILGASGPDVTNHVVSQHSLTLEVQLLGQQKFRRQSAAAALSRTDWDIANQEVAQAIAIVRAFDTVVYREAKLQVIQDFLRLNQQGVEQVRLLVESGSLRPADLILARSEVNDVYSQIGAGRTTLIRARRDLYSALGTLDLTLAPSGTLDRPMPALPADQLVAAALRRRPDLYARRAAIAEAEAELRLQIADRFGSPTVGPVYEFNETRDNFIGMQIGGPIPVFNRRQGEIRQREAQLGLAQLQLRQTEVEVRQDVPTAYARLAEARAWVDAYKTKILPELSNSQEAIERLFQQGQPGVDLLRVLDMRRKLLRARDGYIDALLAYADALADLALAVGDPTLAMGLPPLACEESRSDPVPPPPGQ
jgi:outer membrane protein, heavy metal efflux system